MKVAREEHQKQEQLHLQDREQLTESLHQKDLQYQELLRDTKMRHAEEMLHASESFEERLRETEKRYTARFSSLRTELHLRVKTEVNVLYVLCMLLYTLYIYKLGSLMLVMKIIVILIFTSNFFSKAVFVLFVFEVFIGKILSIKDLTCYRYNLIVDMFLEMIFCHNTRLT